MLNCRDLIHVLPPTPQVKAASCLDRYRDNVAADAAFAGSRSGIVLQDSGMALRP